MTEALYVDQCNKLSFTHLYNKQTNKQTNCCRICNKKGECEHNQCVNCDGKHDATNRRCTEWTTVYQKQANFNTRKREASQFQKDANADILNGPTTTNL